MDFYLLNIDGTHVGPFSVEKAKEMLAQGALQLDSHCWAEGMPEAVRPDVH